MKLSRRTFLKFLAGSSAGLLLTPLPFKGLTKLSQITTPLKVINSGKESFAYTISTLCPSFCPVKIRLVNGQPIQTMPWEGHPLAGQGISCLAAAEVQNLYRKSRLRQPLLRQNGKFVPISRASALALLAKQLNIAGPLASFVTSAPFAVGSLALRSFAGSIKGQFFVMPGEAATSIAAARLMGINAQAGFDTQNSDFVFCVGADVLESWGTALRNRKVFLAEREWSSSEKPRAKKLVFCGPLQNTTALLADEWSCVKPGSEGALMLCLTRLVMDAKYRRGELAALAGDIKDFYSFTNKFTLSYTSLQTGLGEEEIKNIAHALLTAKNPLVISSTRAEGLGDPSLPMLGFILNIILGNLNKLGGLQFIPLPFNTDFKDAEVKGEDLLSEIKKGSAEDFFAGLYKGSKGDRGEALPPRLVMFNECNPLYSLPQSILAGGKATPYLQQAMDKIPFKVFVGSFFNETAAACDLILPISAPLGRYEHIFSPFSLDKVFYSLNRPAVREASLEGGVFSSIGEILQNVAAPLGFKEDASAFAETTIFKKTCEALGANYTKLLDGEVFTSAQKAKLPALFSFNTSFLREAIKDAPMPAKGELLLLPMSRLILENSNIGLPVYAAATKIGKDFYKKMSTVFLNSQTAQEMGLAKNDEVIISLKGAMGHASLNCKIDISDRIPPKSAAMFRGYGHENMDDFSDGKGQNVMQLFAIKSERDTGADSSDMSVVEIVKAQG